MDLADWYHGMILDCDIYKLILPCMLVKLLLPQEAYVRLFLTKVIAHKSFSQAQVLDPMPPNASHIHLTSL